jgi:hypothetical protein
MLKPWTETHIRQIFIMAQTTAVFVCVIKLVVCPSDEVKILRLVVKMSAPIYRARAILTLICQLVWKAWSSRNRSTFNVIFVKPPHFMHIASVVWSFWPLICIVAEVIVSEWPALFVHHFMAGFALIITCYYIYYLNFWLAFFRARRKHTVQRWRGQLWRPAGSRYTSLSITVEITALEEIGAHFNIATNQLLSVIWSIFDAQCTRLNCMHIVHPCNCSSDSVYGDPTVRIWIHGL